jgi:hypothetical protein
MSPELILNTGIVICCVAVAGAVITGIVLRLSRKRLNRQLDAEYGKRRR